MKISRREFLKWSATAAVALNVGFDLDHVNNVLAAETDPPIIWLQGAGCTGCTVSTLNVTNPTTIDDVLLNKISMKYNSTIMASAGDLAMQTLDQDATQYQGQFILVVEGAVPTGANGNYCVVGDFNGTPLTMQQAVLKYGPMAKYVVAAGTCASFGGVSAAGANATGSSSVKTILSGKTANPVVNLAGCPVHPTVLVQTLLDLVLTGMPALDSYNRPTKFFGATVHSTCERRSDGNGPCYEDQGCLGPGCQNVCSSLKWNNGESYCMHVNYGCIGCSNPSYPTNPLLSGRYDD